jgi:tol-pal system protein YbgF
MFGRAIILGLVLCLSACATQQSMLDMSARVDRLEKRLADVEQQQADNRDRIDAVDRRVDSVSAVPPGLDQRMDRIESELKAVSAQLSDLRKNPPAPPPIQAPANPGPMPYVIPDNPVPGTPDYAYQEARNLYLKGEYSAAAKGFRKFLDQYPDHELAPNSQYWLGECRYDLKEYSTAITDFRKVVDYYPNSAKAPDALFKIGLCYRKTGADRQAKTELEQIHKRYPNYERLNLVEATLREMQ